MSKQTISEGDAHVASGKVYLLPILATELIVLQSNLRGYKDVFLFWYQARLVPGTFIITESRRNASGHAITYRD